MFGGIFETAFDRANRKYTFSATSGPRGRLTSAALPLAEAWRFLFIVFIEGRGRLVEDAGTLVLDLWASI